jgi:hypothetical protein
MHLLHGFRRDAGLFYDTDEGGSGAGDDASNDQSQESSNGNGMSPDDLKAELERTKTALKAANKEAGDRRKQLEAIEKQAEDAENATLAEQNKYQTLYEKAQAEKAALEKRFEEVQAQVTRDRIMAAIEAAARAADFADPADAHVFLDVNSIEVDEAGKVKEVETLVKGLATSKPYLVAQREVQPGNGARPKPAGAAGTAAAEEAAKKQHGRWAHSQF